VLFGFSKELLMLSAKDREVEFSLESPLFTLRTKFNLKDMTYRGKPAL
jgi:G:T-mismatch repair DNA endonuclease (very short patch repair protein)